MDNKNSGFSVLDMAEDYAAANQMNPAEIFKRHPVSGNIKAEAEAQEANMAEKSEEAPATLPVQHRKKKEEWRPDPSLTADMPELQGSGAVYNADEVILQEDKKLRNIADDSAMQEAMETKDELHRKEINIEAAKRRHGIVKFQIPEGPYHVSIFAAAGDTNYKRGQEKLDEIFNEIKELHPDFILEWADPEKNNPLTPDGQQSFHQNTGKIDEFPTVTDDTSDDEGNSVQKENIKMFGGSMQPPKMQNASANNDEENGDDVKIVIDKSNVSELSWSPEEVDKIKKARTVELNIVEGNDIEFGSIEDIGGNAVDVVLAPYQRKTNDVVAPLPASKYRATFTGLSFPEVIDLSNSQDMNNIDGEWKKWSICFNHIKNQSIGPWEEYVLYTDPTTKKRVRVDTVDEIPDNVEGSTIHQVSRFEDFLRKTSFMDLEFMLWKILCATAMEKEIISIDCHAVNNGVVCNHNYDWVYGPADLLDVRSINPAVLEDMKKTAEASSKEEIMEAYKSSPVYSMDYVKLSTSGFCPVFGHISAYEYLDEVYSKIKELEESDGNDPTIASRGLASTMLSVVKSFLIPKEDGKWGRITGADNLVKVINSLDEIDWQTISELTRLMLEPYQFKYVLRDIICPKCSNKSSIRIEDMGRLLFIVARSLSSVNVTLKKTSE